ncbi:MAG: replication-relaxation family protein [Armatimonadetes bacterium]|nr:replication-relaxation family protein [Armatimonadota bacterium]
MRITERDVRLLRDVALSHVLSRDQLVKLGYFKSVSRCNRTMSRLSKSGLVRPLLTPFHGQRLYSATIEAAEIVGARIAQLLTNRPASPRFLLHALSVTEVRISVLAKGGEAWRFEAQLWHSFAFHGKTYEVRPDGMAVIEGHPTLIEVDLGHSSSTKFSRKLLAYRNYELCGAFERAYNASKLRVLTFTTSERRKRHFAALAQADERFRCLTFCESGVAVPEVWS